VNLSHRQNTGGASKYDVIYEQLLRIDFTDPINHAFISFGQNDWYLFNKYNGLGRALSKTGL